MSSCSLYFNPGSCTCQCSNTVAHLQYHITFPAFLQNEKEARERAAERLMHRHHRQPHHKTSTKKHHDMEPYIPHHSALKILF